MADERFQLLSKKQETDDVVSFCFDTRGEPITYAAGQFLRVVLPEVTDPRGNVRSFSFASSPTEDFVMIATKITTSPFKQRLAGLAEGEYVTFNGPYGKFTLVDEREKQHMLLSGGIGITPFRSILKYATERKLPHKITLLYSNQTPEDIVFKEDLDAIAKENSNVTIVHTITKPDESKTPWQGITGRINEELIREYATDLVNTIFYICGPPSMVETLLGLVKGMGLLEENIKLERFTGYQ